MLNQLTEITLTNVVLPDICKPTKVISISSFQNRLINQFKIRFKNANIVKDNVVMSLTFVINNTSMRDNYNFANFTEYVIFMFYCTNKTKQLFCSIKCKQLNINIT